MRKLCAVVYLIKASIIPNSAHRDVLAEMQRQTSDSEELSIIMEYLGLGEGQKES